MIIPIMAGYPSNLAKKFSPTEQFTQHILPLLPLYNAQWWGYESLTAIVLVMTSIIGIMSVLSTYMYRECLITIVIMLKYPVLQVLKPEGHGCRRPRITLNCHISG